MEKSSELRKKIKNKDKEGIQKDFKDVFGSLDSRIELSEFFRVGKIVRDLRDYILEECE